MADMTYEKGPETPQNAYRTVRRSLVMAAMGCRGFIEYGAGQAEADALHTRILDWLTAVALWEEVEPEEKNIIRAPMGTLTLAEVIQATWYVEGLAILAWALGLFEFPRHDRKVDRYDVTDAVWFLSEDAGELIEAAKLPSHEELEACRELMYAIDVRFSDFIRHRDKKDITHWVEPDWLTLLGLDIADLMVDGDLAIDGKAISEIDMDRVRECRSISFERHRAIIWLYEGYTTYTQTPVDT